MNSPPGQERKKMKILLINGSPDNSGCMKEALTEVSSALHQEHVRTVTMEVGNNSIRGCLSCNCCQDNHNRCIYDVSIVNRVLDEMDTSDGIIIGASVRFTSPGGTLVSLLDRIFTAGNHFYGKPAAAIASGGSCGAQAALDMIQHYFLCSGMPVITGNGSTVISATSLTSSDKRNLKQLAGSMMWILRCIEAGRRRGITAPDPSAGEEKVIAIRSFYRG